MKQLRNTKIVCTIGPASEDEATFRQLIKAGMNVMRLNFSHGDHEEHYKRILTARKLNEELGTNIAVMLDTRGPEIRTHKFEFGGTTLTKGSIVRIAMSEVLGNAQKFSVTHSDLINDVNIGGKILVDDGNVTLNIIEKDFENQEIVCVVQNDAYIKDRRGINVPGVNLTLDFISERDRADIEFGCDVNVDFIAASFVRRPQDVLDLRELLKSKGKEHIKIVAKIENHEGVNNLEEIIKVADGIMVARGDLGVEVPLTEVPIIQTEIIRKCHMYGKFVITATQMLESMHRNPRPTRAEVSDVANAVLEGSDAIMLSGETANGKYPIEAVQTMDGIARRMEKAINHREMINLAMTYRDQEITKMIGYCVADAALQLNTAAIICPTSTGYTARSISQYRPVAPIIALCPTSQVSRGLALNWGVHPITHKLKSSTDLVISEAVDVTKERYDLLKGEVVIITAGTPLNTSKSTNMMKIEVIE
ncbi:MAG: pyruvate kinase [Bacilli bacterium]|jgi:pyruvate kinase|nr:pyruvate kinase [Acholeplasmataceae bacterium]